MNNECCHQHPENGSDLALQTEAQREETDLRDVNSKLLAALEGLVSKPAPFCEDKLGGSVCPYCDCREHPDDCEWLVARNLWVDISNRAFTEEAKK